MNIWRETQEKKENRNRVGDRNIKIEELELSVRSFNSLKRGGCDTVGDILDLLDEEGNGLRRIRNLGERSETEIKGKLEELRLRRISGSGETDPAGEHHSSAETEADGIRIVLRLPRILWEKEIGEFHLSHYAEDKDSVGERDRRIPSFPLCGRQIKRLRDQPGQGSVRDTSEERTRLVRCT